MRQPPELLVNSAHLHTDGLPTKARGYPRVLDLQDESADKELLIIATGQFLGEGFDCPQVDTLFLAFPLSFKGKLIQYVGRALRSHEAKNNVRVYDYADTRVPILRKMYAKREKTYRSLRFVPETLEKKSLPEEGTFDTPWISTGLFRSDS